MKENLKSQFIEYFTKGFKKKTQLKIGVEHERFLFTGKDKKIIEIMEKSNGYRQEREIVTLDYQITHDKDDDEPSKITPKVDNKQKSLFEF